MNGQEFRERLYRLIDFNYENQTKGVTDLIDPVKGKKIFDGIMKIWNGRIHREEPSMINEGAWYVFTLYDVDLYLWFSVYNRIFYIDLYTKDRRYKDAHRALHSWIGKVEVLDKYFLSELLFREIDMFPETNLISDDDVLTILADIGVKV